MKAKLESKAEVFVADSWFGSVKAAEAMKTLQRDADRKPSGHEFIGAVKTNHKNFPKKDLEETMNVKILDDSKRASSSRWANYCD